MAILHDSQQQVFMHAGPNLVVASGRRWGKSTLIEAEIERALYASQRVALVASYNAIIARGKAGYPDVEQWVVHQWAQDNKLDDLRWALHRFGDLTSLSIDTPIEGLFDLLILDEPAFYPCLAVLGRFKNYTHADTRRLIIGTPQPNGRYNGQFQYLWLLGQKGEYDHEAGWHAFQFHTRENPTIAMSEVARADVEQFVTGAWE